MRHYVHQLVANDIYLQFVNSGVFRAFLLETLGLKNDTMRAVTLNQSSKVGAGQLNNAKTRYVALLIRGLRQVKQTRYNMVGIFLNFASCPLLFPSL